MKSISICLASATLFAGAHAAAAVLTFNSATPTENATVRADWLSAIGIAAPEHLVDFETGFTNGQNITGVTGLFPLGLVITDTGPGTPTATVVSGNGAIGGSNPVGVFALRHDEQPYLELDFSANPVHYLAFMDIDHTGTTVQITHVGGATSNLPSLDSTGGSGNTAEFYGIFTNDLPAITLVRLNSSGDGAWGIDNIEYGIIPEPAGAAGLLLGAAALSARRRRRTD